MKNKTWVIIAVVFVAVMVLAVALYPTLSERYSPESFSENTKENEVVLTKDFTVCDSEMNEVRLSDFFGKPIVVNFWATWCYPCKSELPAFNNAYAKYKDDVVFLMVNLTDNEQETVTSVKKFIAESGYDFPVYYDIAFDASDAADAYDVRSIPETLFINADGSLYDFRIGALSEEVLESYIKKITGEAK